MTTFRNGTTVKTTKKYPRVTAGPLRHKYVHRVVAAAMVGRELERDEEVHHKDGNKKNFWFTNLMILGSKDHGWVSAKQSWYWKQRDHRLKQDWDQFMQEQAASQAKEIGKAKEEGKPWQSRDGVVEQAWNDKILAETGESPGASADAVEAGGVRD